MLIGFKSDQGPSLLSVAMSVTLYRSLRAGQHSRLIRYTWLHVQGPIRAMIAKLIGLEWSVPPLSCWIDDLGEVFSCILDDTYLSVDNKRNNLLPV